MITAAAALKMSPRETSFSSLEILRPLVTLSFLTKLWGLISGSWRDEEQDRGQAMAAGQVQRTRENCQNSLGSALRRDSKIRISSACLRCLPGLWETHQSGAEGGRKVARHIIYWVQAKWQCGYCLHIIDD